MKINETIGIDVSKLTIDVTVHSSQAYCKFKNTKKAFKSMLKWMIKNSSHSQEETLFVFEHTGLYSYDLATFLSENQLRFVMVPGLEIKRSLGLKRGKDDKVDSRAIARYGYRMRDEIKPTVLHSKEIYTLKKLLSMRERYVKRRAADKTTLGEFKRVLIKKDHKILFESLEKNIKHLTRLIKKIEEELITLIKSEQELEKQFKLLTSIKGIGPQVALHVIAYTEGFTKFKTHRQFASYCGVAPFPNVSGTSIRGKTKVSNLANKKLKSLLDISAKSALQFNTEIQLFYQRRLEMGKNKMSTINIIRNKLIARMFAVIKRNSPYVDFMKFAA